MFRLATVVGCAALCLVLASVGVVEAKSPHRRATTAVPASAIFGAAPLAPRPAPAKQVRKVAPKKPPRVRGCRAGLVALTFDDGPRIGTTALLVHELRRLHVPATFFMVGSRVRSYPQLVRLVARNGFAIGNHTWNHADLESLGDPGVRHELRTTARALRAAGVRPSDLARPPYGAVDARVRRDIRELDLHPVLWTIDSRDWAGGTSAQIAARILAAVRPHATNIVLQHDGVDNSPNSVRAVPKVVHALRQRGYCLAALGPHGHPVRPAATPPAGSTQQ